MSVSPPLRQALVAGAALSAGLLGYAAGIEPYWVETVHEEISLPRLPEAFDGYTLLIVSDLHMKQMGRRETSVSRIIANLPEPDLVVVPGDMVHTQEGIAPFLELASGFRSRDGVYAVYGNSEHKNGVRPGAFARTLDEHGIRPLLNRSTVLNRNNQTVTLAGVDDPVNYLDDVDAALEGVPEDQCVVMLMHSPESIANAVRRGVDLVISGHTHGGQVRLPFVGAAYTHVAFGAKMSSGYYAGDRLRACTEDDPGRTQLYVTRGLGVSGIAVRFLCRPELTVLTLKRGPARSSCV